MVVINGVKYACERCIRGHRVSTCTHTDQPLTMIKPKGRPSTQCQHCRDQRKLKNLHINCACQKKGKSPGQHLASCYKNPNGCTCYQNHKLKALDKTKRTKDKPMSENEKSDVDVDFKAMLSNNLSDSSQSNNDSAVNSNSNSNINLSHIHGNSHEANNYSNEVNDLGLDVDDYLIEKNLRLENTGLFDFFSTSSTNDDTSNVETTNATNNNSSNINSNTKINGSSHTSSGNNADDLRLRNLSNSPSSLPFNHDSNESLVRDTSNPTSEEFKRFVGNANRRISSPSPNSKVKSDTETNDRTVKPKPSISALNGNDHPKSEPEEIDINDNYFPLFPLVGNQSFETNESMPLTSIPSNFQSSISRSHSNSFQRNTNRPESVLSINSNSSISTDMSKIDHSAYPPSSISQNGHLNHSQSNLHSANGLSQSQLLNQTQTITQNHKNTFGNILESNELDISDEELEHFLNDFNDNDFNNNNNANIMMELNNPAIDGNDPNNINNYNKGNTRSGTPQNLGI